MASKIKTITVSHPWNPIGDINKTYRVEKLTDTTDFMPHEYLDKARIDELCASRHWKVTIVARAQ